MSVGYLLVRTKPNAVADLDPSDPASGFTPPEIEVWKPFSKGVRGFFAYLRFTLGTGNTATVRVYTRDTARTPPTWQSHGEQNLVGEGVIFEQDDVLGHEVWIGLEDITGGDPIQLFMSELVL